MARRFLKPLPYRHAVWCLHEAVRRFGRNRQSVSRCSESLRPWFLPTGAGALTPVPLSPLVVQAHMTSVFRHILGRHTRSPVWGDLATVRADRKSVVTGKGVSGRVDLGGRRINK